MRRDTVLVASWRRVGRTASERGRCTGADAGSHAANAKLSPGGGDHPTIRSLSGCFLPRVHAHRARQARARAHEHRRPADDSQEEQPGAGPATGKCGTQATHGSPDSTVSGIDVPQIPSKGSASWLDRGSSDAGGRAHGGARTPPYLWAVDTHCRDIRRLRRDLADPDEHRGPLGLSAPGNSSESAPWREALTMAIQGAATDARSRALSLTAAVWFCRALLWYSRHRIDRL